MSKGFQDLTAHNFIRQFIFQLLAVAVTATLTYSTYPEGKLAHIYLYCRMNAR